LADKKVSRIRKPASLGDMTAKKQQDQPLRGAEAFVGKIADPIVNTPDPQAEPKKTEKREKTAARNTKKPAKNAKKQKKDTKVNAALPVEQADSKITPEQPVKKETKKSAAKKNGGKKTGKSRKSVQPQPKPSVRAYFLGGLNEIGKNFTLFECENDMIIVDCGLAFPDEDMPGIDAVIPDFSFVETYVKGRRSRLTRMIAC
jgi:ribonuclease J